MRTLPSFFIATLLIAITKSEVSERAKKLAEKLSNLIIFYFKMNRSILENQWI